MGLSKQKAAAAVDKCDKGDLTYLAVFSLDFGSKGDKLADWSKEGKPKTISSGDIKKSLDRMKKVGENGMEKRDLGPAEIFEFGGQDDYDLIYTFPRSEVIGNYTWAFSLYVSRGTEAVVVGEGPYWISNLDDPKNKHLKDTVDGLAASIKEK